MVVDMKVFILSTCLTTLNTGELVVNHTVDGEDNQEEKTMEVADIKMHHITRNFLQRGRCGLLMVVDMKLVYSFNMSDHIKSM